ALLGNAALRNRVLSGDLGAQELAQMDSESLAPEMLQAQRKASQAEALRSVIAKDPLLPVMAAKSAPGAVEQDWRDGSYNATT
ncbi:unnamed protein product, partial [Polarella glacialis]